MKKSIINEILQIPDKIAVTLSGQVFTIKGPKGELQKSMKRPGITFTLAEKTITITAVEPSRREKKQLYTAKAHLSNTFKGVTEGHTYKLKICSGHFPMNASIKNNVFEIKNFFGETVSRKITLPSDVTVKIAAPEITVEGIDLEKTSQAAASIEQLTRRPGYDKNRFQDGIYITEKDGQPVIN